MQETGDIRRRVRRKLRICCNSINEFRQILNRKSSYILYYLSLTMGSISDGIDNLCLDDEVDLSSVSVNTLLGAIPKVNHVTTKQPSPPPDLAATPQSPTASKKHQRKKNRKDRRRSALDSSGDSAKPPQQMSKVEKLRAAGGGGGAQSNSDKKAAPVTSDEPSILFKSNSSISVNTGIKNLPDSFFSDRLPEEIEEDELREKSERDQKKRKRKKTKRKQTSTEEEDEEKQVSEIENIEEDKLNDKLIDDGPGEEIITHYGDEKCVVSH